MKLSSSMELRSHQEVTLKLLISQIGIQSKSKRQREPKLKIELGVTKTTLGLMLRSLSRLTTEYSLGGVVNRVPK